ncbi:unnamed protein product [Thelazia callipaeda]|uniref:PIH1 domain-containing protein n=1 Tax=Thelazia callipaeda TaxID=103827 RepID=A0A0N5D9H8_THECL|nr:unnamed protein product [Thelazia callipaeda]
MIVESESRIGTTGLEEQDAWIVHPTPGYVVKFREVDSDCRTLFVKEKSKLFLNICHCAYLPPPAQDLDEDEVAKILDSSDPSRYRIPLCVGDVEVVLDRKGEKSVKIDVIVNSTFFSNQLEKSEFFRQLLLLVISDAVEKKHDIKIDVKEAIKLKNRKCVGDLSVQKIQKRPREALIKEINSVTETATVSLQCDSLKNCMLLLRNGKQLEAHLNLSTVKPSVTDMSRLKVRMNDDHLLVILDRKKTILDVYFPVKVNYETAAVKLFADKKMLQVLVPVVW